MLVEFHRRKHRLSIVRDVTTLSVEAFTRDVRCAHALITGGEFGFFRQFLQFLSDHCAARQEHGQPRSNVVIEHEKLEFLAEFAVIAFLRFLQHREVVVEFLLCFKRCTVNALELWIFFVTLVVRTGNGGQLECADISRAHDVRTGAEIDEIAIAIKRDRFVRRNVFDDVELELTWLGTFA